MQEIGQCVEILVTHDIILIIIVLEWLNSTVAHLWNLVLQYLKSLSASISWTLRWSCLTLVSI